MLTFVQIILGLVIFQVLINVIKGISFTFFLQKKGGTIMNTDFGRHFASVHPCTLVYLEPYDCVQMNE